MVRMTFIQGETVAIGIETIAWGLEWGREIWLNSEYNKGKWKFMAKGQGRVVVGWSADGHVLRGNIRSIRGFWLSPSN